MDNRRDSNYIKKYIEDNKDIWSDIDTKKIKVYYFTKDEKKRNGEPKERYFATHKPLDTSFDQKKIKENVTDTGIQKILLAHLEVKGNDPELAFSPDGIDEMNRNIVALNNGKFHQPILKVRVYEKADKFAVGQKGNKGKKFVEAAKGTNLFFAIYINVNKVRSYYTIPLSIVIDRLKKNLSPVPEYNEKGELLLFFLSPGDLVYIPKDESDKTIIDFDIARIYKFVSGSSYQGFFIPYNIANPLISTTELGSNNKSERAWSAQGWSSEMIKEKCIPLSVNRIGDIKLR